MKKPFILTMLTILTASIHAQQSWDFTQTPATDVSLLSEATTEWSYTEGSNRYESILAINGPITAGQRELTMTKGLTVDAAAKKIRIDVDNRLQLAGKNIPLTTPQLKAGQVVTITFASTGDAAVTFDELTNLVGNQGFTAADKNTRQTGTGTVAADGTVSFKSTGGSINIYSISVSEGSEPTGEPTAVTHDVAPSTQQSQALITLSDGSVKYYNTGQLNNITIGDEGVIMNLYSTGPIGIQDTYSNVSAISFAKKADQGQPADIINGQVEITESKGWLESLYAKWNLMDGADGYAVYVKGDADNDYTKLDDQLIRNYGTYGRADAVGLRAGTYELRVVPVVNGQEVADGASTVTGLEVRNYDRTGYAHFNYRGVGAYNDDGTLKSNAKVFYVTAKTAKTITTNVAGAKSNPCKGIQHIICAYEQGEDKTPIAFRFIGNIDVNDLDSLGSKEEGIQVKGRRADSELNMTFEGIGDDATINHFGFLVRNAKSVEFRNFANIRCMDDGISLDTNNSNIWLHHLDMFYGKHGSGDHIKGDGTIDAKADSKYITVNYCRFWDAGKCNMFGMKDEGGPNYISYHHNWFDHSDSRHPRVRTMSVHVWNNYFDNVAKYGVGAATGASIFVENNYFLKTKKPMLSSQQGTDGLGSGTFSGENGGIIKAYGNYIDHNIAHFSYYTQKNPSSKGYDAYEVDSRDEQVPATEKTLAGATTYNNFDTDPQQIYQYTPDAAADVPAIVTGYYGAGRLNHGDISYTFPDNTGDEEADSKCDEKLVALIDNYKSALVGFFGEQAEVPGDEPGNNPNDNPGDDPTPQPEGTIVCSFDGTPSQSMFTMAGSTGDGKITYNGAYYKTGAKLNSSGSVTFTPKKNYQMTLVLATSKDGRDVKLNGVTTTVSGTTNTDGAYYQMEPIAITADDIYTITKGTKESILMLIILEPVE